MRVLVLGRAGQEAEPALRARWPELPCSGPCGVHESCHSVMRRASFSLCVKNTFVKCVCSLQETPPPLANPDSTVATSMRLPTSLLGRRRTRSEAEETRVAQQRPIVAPPNTAMQSLANSGASSPCPLGPSPAPKPDFSQGSLLWLLWSYHVHSEQCCIPVWWLTASCC